MIPWLLWYFCTLWLKGSCIWSLLLSIWVDIHISTNTGSHKANITCPILQCPQCLQSTNTALGRKKKWSDPKSSPHHCLPYALHANMVVNFHEKHQYFNQYLLHYQLSPNREKIWPTTFMLLPDLLQGSNVLWPTHQILKQYQLTIVLLAVAIAFSLRVITMLYLCHWLWDLQDFSLKQIILVLSAQDTISFTAKTTYHVLEFDLCQWQEGFDSMHQPYLLSYDRPVCQAPI